MKTPLQISVPTPCHENWKQMTTVEKGRFCGACQKKVIDFTKSTDGEILQAYAKDKKLCGRFLNTQLDRELMAPHEKKSIWLASVLFGMLSLSSYKSLAQDKENTLQTPVKHVIVGKPAMPVTQKEIISHREKTITGIVSDGNGPLPGVNVVIKGTQTGIQTAFDGTYSIKAKVGDTLVYSFMGMKDIIKVVDNTSTVMNVKMEDYPQVMMGAVAYVKQKTYMGRQLQKIGNWFR